MADPVDGERPLLGRTTLDTVAFLICLAVFVGGAVMLALTIEYGVLLMAFGLGGLAVFRESVTATESSSASSTAHAERDPLSIVRERYARGELTDEEFERRLDRLLETEDDAREPSTREQLTEKS